MKERYKQAPEVDSRRSKAKELLDLAFKAQGPKRRELIEAWMREIKYLHAIRHGWRRWMGGMPEWLAEK